MRDYGFGFLNKSTLLRIGVGAFFALFWFSLAADSWDNNRMQIGSHLLLAFLSLISIAQVSYHLREISNPQLTLLNSSFIYFTVIHTSAALIRIVAPLSHMDLGLVIANVLEITVIGLFANMAVRFRQVTIDQRRSLILSILISIPFIVFQGIFYLVVLPSFLFLDWYAIAWLVGIIAVAFYLLAARRVAEDYSVITTLHLPNILVGYTLMGFSLFPLIFVPFVTFDVQGLSATIQAVALFFFNSSLTKAFEKKGVQRSISVGLTIFLLLVPSIPFIITQIVVEWLPDFTLVEIGAFAVTHLSSGLISSVMALLLFLSLRNRKEVKLYPLSLIFATWSVTEFFHFFYSQTETVLFYGETFAPYIIGSLFTVFLLATLIHRVSSRSESEPHSKLWLILPIYILFLAFALVIAEIIQWYAFDSIEGLIDEPYGDIITLVFNLIAMFEIAYLAYMLFEVNKYRFSIELMGLGSLSLWIVPGILKRLFEDWTSGFWAAEIFLLFAVALGPALLGILYMYTSIHESKLREEADLYADLLMHDIGNHLQALLISVDLVCDDQTEDLMKQMALRDARDVIIRGENLVRNVRRLTQKGEGQFIDLESTDLLAQIHTAFKLAMQRTSSDEITFIVNSTENAAHVIANDSLVDVFFNLFNNSILYSEETKRIEVNIDSHLENEKEYWRTRVIDYGRGISPNLRTQILESIKFNSKRSGLGLAVAKLLITSYGGFLRIQSRVQEDYTQGTSIEIFLRKAIY